MQTCSGYFRTRVDHFEFPISILIVLSSAIVFLSGVVGGQHPDTGFFNENYIMYGLCQSEQCILF